MGVIYIYIIERMGIMIEACTINDGLDEFIALCDEHENEMNLEAARKLYRKKDFDCWREKIRCFSFYGKW